MTDAATTRPDDAATLLPHRFDPADPDLPERFDELSLWAARFGTLLLDELPIPTAGPWLDLGCGTGFPLLELAQIIGPGARAVGVDVWGPALARAARKAAAAELRHVSVVRADGASLPFPAARFTLVVSNLGVNNFPDPAAALAEVGRVLAPGGVLALTTNPYGHMAEVYAALRAVLEGRGLHDRLAALETQERHRPSRSDLERLIAGAGLVAPRVVERTATLRYGSGAALLAHALTRWGFLGGWRSAIGDDVASEVLTEAAAKLDGNPSTRGGIAVTVPQLYLEARRQRS